MVISPCFAFAIIVLNCFVIYLFCSALGLQINAFYLLSLSLNISVCDNGVSLSLSYRYRVSLVSMISSRQHRVSHWLLARPTAIVFKVSSLVFVTKHHPHVPSSHQWRRHYLEPCADYILSAAARRPAGIGGGGANKMSVVAAFGGASYRSCAILIF